MNIKEYVLMLCNVLQIEKGSGSIDDYEMVKEILALRLKGIYYQQAIKVLADYIGV
jgi:hypothetical protein